MRYRKVDVMTWGDARFRALSPLLPSAQALWLFLLTTPMANMLPGVIPAGRAALAEALGWTQSDFDRCWKEVEQSGMARADWAARLVWLPNAARYNRPESPNVVRSWRASWESTPECPLKVDIRRATGQALTALGPGFARAWGEVVGDGRAAGKRAVSDVCEAGEAPVNEKSVGTIAKNSAPVPEGFRESIAITGTRTRSHVHDQQHGAAERTAVYDDEEQLFMHLFRECPEWDTTRRKLTTERAHLLDVDAIALCRRLVAGGPFKVSIAAGEARAIIGRFA